MLRGIYTSCTGMVAEMDRQNTIANNLANVDTVGFKRDNVTPVPFAELLLNAYNKRGVQRVGPLGLGVQAVTRFVNFSDGPVRVTGNQTDLALQGSGLFAVDTPNGVRYQRAGNFILDKDRYLVTVEGFKVLGENGPIQVEDGDFSINQEGIVFQNDQVLNRLLIFSTENMSKEGEYFYTCDSPQLAANYRIIQGAQEQSNINTVSEMIQMITATRAYDTNQKAVLAHDETLGKAVNDLAR
ncbi:MAG: flagellar hook-basal body protein [Firmicutes bacterium]|nr:flagellar hook-basal body protein [Bacillota bacterium]